eukprot:scaffold3354_cov159-Cylindrotheca_fusiformis.AAC.1
MDLNHPSCLSTGLIRRKHSLGQRPKRLIGGHDNWVGRLGQINLRQLRNPWNSRPPALGTDNPMSRCVFSSRNEALFQMLLIKSLRPGRGAKRIRGIDVHRGDRWSSYNRDERSRPRR